MTEAIKSVENAIQTEKKKELVFYVVMMALGQTKRHKSVSNHQQQLVINFQFFGF